ncbi:MAG: hypothetical protein IPM29_13420 [Planctomycetes bacterium]|nr:hypothetical protein [Planctomycetota bacterium]
MPDPLLVLAHLLALALCALALVLPAWRGRAATVVGVLALAAAAAALAGPASRTAQVVFRFAAFEGANIVWKPFVVETVTAAGHAFGMSALVFALPWCAFLLGRRPGGASGAGRHGAGVHPFWGPLLLAWSAVALQLAFEKTAAPHGLVEPAGLERALLPPSLAAAALLALRIRKVLPTFLWLAVFVTVARLPLAIWGTLATREQLGTSLDVHTVTRFANPFAQVAMHVDAGSNEQLAWLVWAPNLLILPGLYMLSLGGVAFAVVMWAVHAPRRREEEAAA